MIQREHRLATGQKVGELRFDGRVAIVTGSGGGLGRAHALELARRGAALVINDLGGAVDGTGKSHSFADKVVEEITQAGGRAVANYDSVATPEGGRGIVQTALDAFGRLDILINNAGILRDKSFAKMTPEEFDAVNTVHLRGAFHVTQPAFVAMKEAGYGRLVFTSSASGLFGNFGQANYGAAKAGLLGLSNVLAVEGRKYNIHSNVIAPLATTRLSEHIMGAFSDLLAPDQVTPMVVYLCSEESEITHEVFSAGGGRYARIFVGLGPGWFAGKKEIPTVEDISDHLEIIRKVDTFTIPADLTAEMKILANQLQG